MNKIDELIQKLCPDGIFYCELGAVCKDCAKEAISQKNISVTGTYPVINSSRNVLGFVEKYNNSTDTIVLTSHGAYAGFCHYMAVPFFAGALCYPMKSNSDKVLTKYLYYIFKSIEPLIREKYVNKSGVPYINAKALMSYKIPIPPLPVQEEIVRILDKFTELEAELEAELEKEMEARKKQYEWYRDRLLSFDESVPMVKLENIATDIYRGAGIKKDEVTSDGIPCVRYGEIYTSYDISFTECISHTQENVVSAPKYFEHGDILFTITGESIEEIGKSIAYLGHEKCMAGGDIVVMKHNQEPRYISYALSTTAAQMQKSKGKVKSKVVHSSVPALKEIEIPLPDIATQKRIADLLDSFHALCNDITTGLPAEIAARRKQYKYYRDKLLSFEEVA